MVESAGVDHMDWNMEFLDPFSVGEAEQHDNSVNILTSRSTGLHDDNTPNCCDANNNSGGDKFNDDKVCNLLPDTSSSLPENLCIRKLIETEENRPELSAANERQLMSKKDTASVVITLAGGENFQTKTAGERVEASFGPGVRSENVDGSSVSLKVSPESARNDKSVSDSRASVHSSVDSTASSIPVILSSSMHRGKGGAREQCRRFTDHWTSASAVTSHCNVDVSVAVPGSRYSSKCAVGTFPPRLRMPAPAQPLTVPNSSPYMQYLRPAVQHTVPVVSGSCAPGPAYRQPYWQQISPRVPVSPLVSAVGSNAAAIYPRPTVIPPPPIFIPYVGTRPPAIPNSGPSFAARPPAPPFIHPYGMPPGVDIGSPPPSIPSSATIPPFNPLETVDHFRRMPQTVYWPPPADHASSSVAVSNTAAWLQVPPPSLSTSAGLSAVCIDRSWFPTAGGVSPSVEHLPAMSATEPLVRCNAGCAGNSVSVGGFPPANFPPPTSRYNPLYSSQYQYPKADDRTLHGSTDVSNCIHTDFLQKSCVHSSWPTYPPVLHDHATSTATTTITNSLNPDRLGTSKGWYSSSSSLPSNNTVPPNTINRDLSTFQRMHQIKNNTLSVVPSMSSCSSASQKQNSISATFVWPSDNQQRTVASQTVATSVSTAKGGTFCNQTHPGSFHASTVLTPLSSVKLRNSQNVRPPVASVTSHNLPTAALLPPKVSRDVAAKIPAAAPKLRPPVAGNQTLSIDASANWNSLLLASAVSEIASEASSLQPGNVAELLQKIFFAANMPNVAAGMRLIVQGLTESSHEATGSCGIAADDDVAPPPPPPPQTPAAGCFTVPIPPPLPSLAELTGGGKMEIDGDLMTAGETDRTELVRRLTRRATDFVFSSSQNSDQLDNSDIDDTSEPISGSNSRSVSRLSAGGDACSRSSSSTNGSEAGTLLLLSPSQNTSVTTTVVDSFAGTPLSESSDKTDRMNRIVDQVRLLLKPFYKRGDIDTQTYKDVMRKAVPKIIASRSVTLNSRHIEKFVEAYVTKIIARHQQMDAATTTKPRTKKNK